MRVLAHPLRLDGSGGFATVPQGSAAHAQQLAVAVVSTLIGERDLAPDFGIFDPVAVGLSWAEVVAAMSICEPDLTVTDVAISQDGDRQDVAVTVAWNTEED